MSIDTGLSLVYNPNFPVPDVDQPSQGFRDNFSIIKSAVENLQVASSSSSSVLSISTSVGSTGAVQLAVGYSGNTLVLPTGDPTAAPAAGAIRYITGTGLQFYDGSGWRTAIFLDQNGLLTLSRLTVSTNLTLSFTPVNSGDAVSLGYVKQAISDGTNAAVMQATNSATSTTANSVQQVQNNLDAEASARANAVNYLQQQIDAQTNANSASAANSTQVQNQIAGLQQAQNNEANARVAGDNLLNSNFNNLSNTVSTNQNTLIGIGNDLGAEISDRENGDQALSDMINAAVLASSNAVVAEANARAAADLVLANSIVAMGNAVPTEASARIAGDNALDAAKVNRTGDSISGTLTMTLADLILNGGNLTMNDGVYTLNDGDMVLSNSSISMDAGQSLSFFRVANANAVAGLIDSGFVTFDADNAEYAAVRSNSGLNGCLRIGTTANATSSGDGDNLALESAADLYLRTGMGNATSVEGSIYVGNANAHTVSIETATGNITSQGTVTAANITGSSDQSLKDNVSPITDALKKVIALQGVTYNRNDMDDYPEQIGLIAQHVANVVPQVVHQQDNGLLSLAYGNLTALLIEAIKELSGEVEHLRALVKSDLK